MAWSNPEAEPAFFADVSRAEVAQAGGGNLADFASGEHNDQAMKTMAAGLEVIVKDLHAQGKLDGIFSMGGAGGTSVATRAMRALPIGIPKVMVSTVGGSDVSTYAGTTDITFIPSIVDVAGINRLSRTIYANGSRAIAGMVKMERPEDQSLAAGPAPAFPPSSPKPAGPILSSSGTIGAALAMMLDEAIDRSQVESFKELRLA